MIQFGINFIYSLCKSEWQQKICLASHKNSATVLGISRVLLAWMSLKSYRQLLRMRKHYSYPLTSFYLLLGKTLPSCWCNLLLQNGTKGIWLSSCVGPTYLYFISCIQNFLKGQFQKDFGCDHLANMFYIIIQFVLGEKHNYTSLILLCLLSIPQLFGKIEEIISLLSRSTGFCLTVFQFILNDDI